jgi:hypothetical protein
MFLGIDVDTAYRLWDRTLELYMGGADHKAVLDTARKAQIFGCIRIIDFVDRHKEMPDREKCLKTCTADITELMTAIPSGL